MRLSIDHRTTYSFSAPQRRLVQLLRMTPENTHDQTIASWHITVDCDARMRRHRDGFGNCTTMLYCEGPIEGIEICVTGEVVTSHSDGVLHGTHEPLPAALFLRDTPLTTPDEAIRDLALGLADREPIARLHALNHMLHDRITLLPDQPASGRTAAMALAEGAGTPRDLAHAFIAGAHALGVPARFVSGYCDLAGDDRCAPHAWADAWVEGRGWIAFDPATGLCPEEHHVRVAVALDGAGAAPVAGSRLGEGRERMEVAVTVQREG